MFTRPALLISIIQAALLLSCVEARTWLLERDGRAIFARRFGQAQPVVLKEIAAACGGGVCDALADEAVAPLLAAQPECSQQDMADKIIDASRQFCATTQARMIAAAVKYRQTEKNTLPDYSTYPPTLRNSVYCQKAPKNSQLNGLVQAQDSANDLNLFFDPATGTTVTRGSQPNTLPFGTNVPLLGDQVRLAARGMTDGTNSTSHDGNGEKVLDANPKNNGTSTDDDKGSNKKDGGKNGDKKNGDKKKHKDGGKKDGGKKDDGKKDGKKDGDKKNGDDKNGDKKNGGDKNGDSKNGNDKNGNNKTDKTDSNLKTNAGGNMGNNSTLLNPMKDGNNKTTDGVKSNMASGNGTDKHNGMHKNNGTNKADGKNGTDSTNSKNGTDLTSGNNSTDVASGNNSTDAGNIGNFGSCSVPEIQFGAGFDGRRETAFEPVDKVSYNHGSAQNIDIITQFMCDQLVNTCKADDTAKATCARAKTAADGAPAKTGKQADAFNAVFGKTTNFANITPLDDQGNPVNATSSSLRRGLSRMLRRTEGYLEDA